MEEIKENDLPESGLDAAEDPPRFGAQEPQVMTVLLAQIGLCLALGIFGALLYTTIATAAGWDTSNAQFTADATLGERWQLRLMLGISHVTTFLVAGFATVWLFYRDRGRTSLVWQDYLAVRKAPSFSITGLALLLMLVSVPLVLFTYTINKALPMPESWRMMEDSTETVLKGLLHMDTPIELIGNLIIIALLPAIGEELVFRGVLQQQLMRRIANPWVAMLVTAAIFSLIHFQFEGFIPRMMLGMILGWLYWQTRNFWVPVTAHFFNNALQVFGQYLYGKQITSVDLDQDIDVPWFAALASLAMVWAVCRLIIKTNR